MGMPPLAPEPVIRLASATDHGLVLDLMVAFREHQRQSWPSRQEFSDALTVLFADAATDLILACDREDVGLGYVMSRYRFSAWVPGASAELEDVFVREDARGRGIGRRLVSCALERAEARGCRLVSVTTNERNTPALTLYGGYGFRAERERWAGGRALWLERWRDDQ